jgi:hypothetical protein
MQQQKAEVLERVVKEERRKERLINVEYEEQRDVQPKEENLSLDLQPGEKNI